jgi:uncharacterized protein (UPF0254 family)
VVVVLVGVTVGVRVMEGVTVGVRVMEGVTVGVGVGGIALKVKQSRYVFDEPIASAKAHIRVYVPGKTGTQYSVQSNIS